MNGRVYDPMLGRFLIADKIIQAPGSTQSYNRFSYVMNNPLMFTDPSGYKAAMNIEINATTIYDERGNVIGMRPFNGNVSQYGGGSSIFTPQAYRHIGNGFYVNRAGEGVSFNEVNYNYITPNAMILTGPSALENAISLVNNGYYVKTEVRYGVGAETGISQFEGGKEIKHKLWGYVVGIKVYYQASSNGVAQAGGGSDWINTTNNINTGIGVGTGVLGGNYGLTANQTFRYAQRINGRVVSAAELTVAHTAQSMKVANALGRVNLVTGVLGSAYSTGKVISDYNNGGWQKVNGLDVADAAVGWGGVGVGVLATIGMVSNPVGWVVGIGTGIYFGARLIYDLSKD